MENNKKLRVAAYVRVSEETKETQHSLQAQEEFYRRQIHEKVEWELAEIYKDNGISGTDIKRREGFVRLISDCKAGKIDLILVKSVSRFARNTLDLLRIVRYLKQLGVSVRFEEQNIDSLTEEGELMLTLIASVAQAESESISENIKWAIHKAFQNGIGNTRRRTLGYHWVDGKLTVIPEEAEVVKRIFTNFLAGGFPYENSRGTDRGRNHIYQWKADLRQCNRQYPAEHHLHREYPSSEDFHPGSDFKEESDEHRGTSTVLCAGYSRSNHRHGYF